MGSRRGCEPIVKMFPPIEDLVPHGAPIRVLEELLAYEAGKATCRMTVRADTPWVRDGAMESVVTLEIMAQAVAACLGYEAFLDGDGVRVGMLVGVRKMELFESSITVGSILDVVVARQRGTDDMSTFLGHVFVADRMVAQANMTLFHTEKPPA